MGYYCEALDTAKIAPLEMATAKTVLQLRAMCRAPVRLSWIHACVSKTILDECISDNEADAFLSLVRRGRVQFCRDVDKRPHRESLIAGLRNPTFREDGAWPEVYWAERNYALAAVEGKKHKKDLRLAGAIADALAKNGSSGILDRPLAARIERACALFSAIECAEDPTKHKGISPLRGPLIETAHATAWADDLKALQLRLQSRSSSTNQAILGELNEVLKDETALQRRSATFTAIDLRDPGPLRESVREMINGVYSNRLAKAVGQQFMSLSRQEPALSENTHGPTSDLRPLQPVELRFEKGATSLDAELARQWAACALDWEDIANLTLDRTSEAEWSGDNWRRLFEQTVKKLGQGMAERRGLARVFENEVFEAALQEGVKVGLTDGVKKLVPKLILPVTLGSAAWWFGPETIKSFVQESPEGVFLLTLLAGAITKAPAFATAASSRRLSEQLRGWVINELDGEKAETVAT